MIALPNTTEVRAYYEENTKAFKRYGQGGDAGVIRRAVWGPGVETRAAAFGYVDALIGAELLATKQRLASPSIPRVFDFGCGLGASLLALSATQQLEGVGITISPVQARLARQRFAAAGLSDRLICLEADFLNLSCTLEPADLIFAIEAYVHSPAPEAFFAAAARQLRPGGTLVICDDFESTPDAALRSDELQCLKDVRYGWVAPSVAPFSRALSAAEAAGFQLLSTRDLTGFLELGRPRDRAIAALVALGRHFPLAWLPSSGSYRWRSLLGGSALQSGLRAGLLEHRFAVWTKTPG